MQNMVTNAELHSSDKYWQIPINAEYHFHKCWRMRQVIWMLNAPFVVICHHILKGLILTNIAEYEKCDIAFVTQMLTYVEKCWRIAWLKMHAYAKCYFNAIRRIWRYLSLFAINISTEKYDELWDMRSCVLEIMLPNDEEYDP